MAEQSGPTGYGELADVLESLPLILREMRRARGLSLRAAATEMGMSFSTVTRFEHGDDGATMTTVLGIMRWIDQTNEADQ